jgi:hypothetical protein
LHVIFCTALIFIGLNTPVWAEGFNNKDFLKLENEQKKFWLLGAIESLTYVAAAKSTKQGQCVHDWYHTDNPKKVGLIIASMEKYPDVTPGAIILALSERVCGTYRK